jgi:hypothetical protein
VVVEDGKGSKHQSHWARILLIGGVASLFVAVILAYAGMEAVAEAGDPRIANDAELNVDESQTINLKKGCIIAFSTGDELQLEVHDSSDQVIEESRCGEDFEGIAEDGTSFSRVGSWRLNSEEYSMRATCTEGAAADCSEEKVWVVNYEEAILGMWSSIPLLAALGLCFFGIVLIPLGATLAYTVPKNQQNTVLILDQNGQPVQVNGEIVNATITNQATDNPNHQSINNGPTVSNDNLHSLAQQEGTLQETPASGHLLTTDQVYVLMHGSQKDKVQVLETAAEKQLDDAINKVDVEAPFSESFYADQQDDEGARTMENKVATIIASNNLNLDDAANKNQKQARNNGSRQTNDDEKSNAWKSWDEA